MTVKRVRIKTPEQKKKFAEYMRKWNANNRDTVLERKKQYYAQNREAIRERMRNRRKSQRWSHMKSLYGVDDIGYGRLMELQNGRCKICNLPPRGKRPLFVDHDHATGEIRGLLCHHCNAAIGLMQEDPSRFLSAIEYLNSIKKIALAG